VRGVRGARAGLLSLLLIVPSVRAEDGISWKRAHLAGAVGRTAAVTAPLTVRGPDQVELRLVLEGERGGLPVYCSPAPGLRIEGRRVAGRLVLLPADCGLEGAEVQWVTLEPAPDLSDWRRTRITPPEDGWTLPVQELSGEAPGIEPIYGTMRWAAAIALPDGRRIGTDGWSKRADWTHPEHAPGYAVTRTHNASLAGQLVGLARLPVTPDATLAHERARVAFTSCGIVLGAYEAFAGMTLPGDAGGDSGESVWSWLFFDAQNDIVRREPPGAACVGPRGRPVPWADRTRATGDGVRRGDVLRLGDECVVLESDDGDGWLGNGDRVLLSSSGTLARGTLGEVPARRGGAFRPRDFQRLRLELNQAGYGDLGVSWVFGPDLQRAVREFQRDQGLPETGVPDAATEESLVGFLGALGAARSGAE